MAGVDEPLQAVRAAVGLVHRPQVDPVVAPAVTARERGDRHQLDHGRCRGRARWSSRSIAASNVPVRGERAHVQLVEHRPVQRAFRASRGRSSGRRNGHSCGSRRARRTAAAANAGRAAAARRPAGTRSRSRRVRGRTSASHQPGSAAGLVGCRSPSACTSTCPAAGAHTRNAVTRRPRAAPGLCRVRPQPGGRGRAAPREVVRSGWTAAGAAGMRGAGQHVPPRPGRQRQHRVRPAAPPPQPAGQPGGDGHRGAARRRRPGRAGTTPRAGPPGPRRPAGGSPRRTSRDARGAAAARPRSPAACPRRGRPL